MPRIQRLSSRHCRGKGWHKKGYREYGDLYFQLKRTFADFSREWWINENETITALIKRMHDDVANEDVGKPRHLDFVFFFRKKVLEPSEDRVRTVMDGGETVYAKVFDEDGQEWVYTCYAGGWEPKAPFGQRGEQNARVRSRGLY